MKKIFSLIFAVFFIFSLNAQSHISTQSHQAQVTQIAPVSARGTDGELTEDPTGPCGACRQVIIESETRAGNPIRILLYGRKFVYIIDGIRPLMPLTFSEF